MTPGAFDDELRRAFDSLSDRLCSDLTDQLNAIVSQLARAAATERESAVANAATQARNEAARELDEAGMQARQLAERLRELETATAQARVEQQTRHPAGEVTAAARLVEAIHVIDAARSLSEILDTLVSCTAREAARVAVLLVCDPVMRGWRFIGFAPSFDAASAVDLAVEAAGIVGEAVRTRTSAAGRSPASVPGFAQLPADREAVAVPLLLAGKPVAVLYADEGVADAAQPVGTASIEVLTRYAARALEAITAFRTAQAVTGNRGVSHEAALAGAGPAAAPGDEEAARRYARLIISEIKLHHEPAVAEGCRERDLMARLGGEIARARVLYEQRVAPTVPGAADHFRDELVRTLANGDASLL
jgi:hypothetical protein